MWSNFPPIPVPVRSHCVVTLSPTEIMVIGGNTGVEDGLETQKTFILSESLVWTEGPPLSKPRQGHSCGRINSIFDSGRKRVIVVGGKNAQGYLKEVEVFDEDLKTWQLGPELPFGISQAGLVEDRNGGIVLVGGDIGVGLRHQRNIYKLTHFESPAGWKLMKQQLAVGRLGHAAFLVPDEITDCKEPGKQHKLIQ